MGCVQHSGGHSGPGEGQRERGRCDLRAGHSARISALSPHGAQVKPPCGVHAWGRYGTPETQRSNGPRPHRAGQHMLAVSMAHNSWGLPSSNTPQRPTVPEQCWPLPRLGGGRGGRGGTHRVWVQPHVCVHVRLGLGLDSQLCLQNLLHRHVLVGTARGLHLVLVPVLAPLPFLLHSCTGGGGGQPTIRGQAVPAPSQCARQGRRGRRCSELRTPTPSLPQVWPPAAGHAQNTEHTGPSLIHPTNVHTSPHPGPGVRRPEHTRPALMELMVQQGSQYEVRKVSMDYGLRQNQEGFLEEVARKDKGDNSGRGGSMCKGPEPEQSHS